MNKEQIKAAFFKLSRKDRHDLIRDLGLLEQGDSELPLTRREQLDNKQGGCPHCQSNKYRKHGLDKGSQRYKCKNCGRTFTEFTGTWISGIHKKELTGDYIKLMEQELSLDKIRDRLVSY